MAVADTILHNTRATLVLSRILRPSALAPTVALIILFVLVVLPVILMVLASLRPPNTFPLEGTEFTLNNFNIFTAPGTGVMLQNTLIYAVGGMILALPIAFTLAFLTERTDLPMRDWVYAMMFIPASIPTFATALGWVLLLGPRAGTLNQWIRIIFGLDISEGPFNIFSMHGMVFVHVIGIVPAMWLILIGMFRNMDPALEESAATAGAGRLRSIRQVTAPLMFPGLMAAVILFLVSGLEALETPLALGRSAGIDVLATRVFDLVNQTTDQGFAYGPPATLGMLGLSAGMVGIWLYMWLVRHAEKYAVVTGKGYRPRLIKLGRWGYVILGMIFIYLFLRIVLPTSILVATSFMKFYQPMVPGVNIVWTLTNWEELLDYRFFGRYVVNTIIVALGAATAVMMLSTFFAWQVTRWPGKATRLVNALAFMPLSIPNVISGLAFLILFITSPLYGTLLLIVLVFTANALAFGTRLMHAAQLQIHKELEEASLVAGVGYLPTFLFINLRLLFSAFVNGWLWTFANVTRNFTTPLMVATAGTLLAANEIYGRFFQGDFPTSSAMMVFLIAFNVIIVLGARRWIVRALQS